MVRHPVVFHLGSETVSNATLKLHGQSSWAQTAMLDGNRAKIQFDISFHQSDPNGKFHGIEKLVFDMPRSDWTFMHDRLAHAWLRQVGIAAGCAANARVEINGSYYGMYVAEENTNKRVIAEFFPNNPSGGLWKGAVQPETALTLQAANQSRQATFTQATDLASISAIVDLQSSVVEWASEALLNNADGTYGGNHNLYIYDQGAKGFVYLPNDTDSTFDWLSLFDLTPSNDHPIYWWANRAQPMPGTGRRLAGGDERSRPGGASTSMRSPPSSASGTSSRFRDGSTAGRSRSRPTWPPIRTPGRRRRSSRWR